MKNNKILLTFFIASLFMPVLTFAALDGVKGLLKAVGGLINLVIPILFGLSLVYFFWGVTQFILHDAGNEKTREDGKKKMMWGIIALFVFISIFGIINWIGGVFGISTSTTNSTTQTSSGFNGNLTPQQGGWTPSTF